MPPADRTVNRLQDEQKALHQGKGCHRPDLSNESLERSVLKGSQEVAQFVKATLGGPMFDWTPGEPLDAHKQAVE